MKYTMCGFSLEAKRFLSDKMANPGDPCWCCGLPLPETAVKIGEFKRGERTFLLHRYVMKENGWVAEEYLQAEIITEHETRLYLALRVKPDGILAHGDGKTIQWPWFSQ